MKAQIMDKEMRLSGVTAELEFTVIDNRLHIVSGLLIVKRDGKELISGLTEKEMDWILEHYYNDLYSDWQGSRIDYLEDCEWQAI